MKSIYSSLTLATLMAAVPAFGQCPANPLTALSGPWTFNIQSNSYLTGRLPAANHTIAGRFVASVGADRAGNPIGLLTIQATTAHAEAVGNVIPFRTTATIEEVDAGRYQINDTCTGGTLTMNLSSYPMQYDFVFVNGGAGIYIVSAVHGKGATGSAVRGVVGGCPAEPLSLVSGPYAFKFQTTAAVFPAGFGMAGRMVASIGTNRANQPIGLLDVTATSTSDPNNSVTRLERDAGRFLLNSDCTGGTLFMNLSSKPLQYQFYFRAGYNEFDVIGISGLPIWGVVTKTAAAACPANPLSILSGAWTFSIPGIAQTNPAANWAAVGRWVASIGADRAGNAIGVLNINATSQQPVNIADGNPTRLEDDLGRFQIWDDCTGGTLTFNLSSRPMQFDFWFYDGGRSMYIVSTVQGRGATGSATLGVPAGCPAGVNPLSLVSGLYSLKLQRLPAYTNEAYGLAGWMNASIGTDRAGNPLGVLAITATSNIDLSGTVTRVESDAGRYAVEADCTSGVLTFNLSSRPVEFQFYFRAGYRAMDMISLRGPLAYGEAVRF